MGVRWSRPNRVVASHHHHLLFPFSVTPMIKSRFPLQSPASAVLVLPVSGPHSSPLNECSCSLSAASHSRAGWMALFAGPAVSCTVTSARDDIDGVMWIRESFEGRKGVSQAVRMLCLCYPIIMAFYIAYAQHLGYGDVSPYQSVMTRDPVS